MDQQEPAITLNDIKVFLSVEGKPVSTAEFKEFWAACSTEEREQIRQAVKSNK